MDRQTTKINISINQELLDRIDQLAEANYLSRSGLIAIACSQYVNQNAVVSALTEMSAAIKQIAVQGQFNDEDMKKLEDFQRICSMIYSSQK